MRISTIILLSTLGFLVVSAVVGNYLESAGILTKEKLEPRGVATVVVFYLGLFCVIAAAAVPVLVRFFIAGQAKAGNAGQPIIQWLQSNESTLVYSVWGFFATGLVIAVILAWDNISGLLK